MRLLKINDHDVVSLAGRIDEREPRYAILSHTWGDDDEEVELADLKQGQGQDKVGYRKLQFCGRQAREDGIQYFWVDTCCIDKANFTEVSEAITSMFRWYRGAVKCYAYLSDVSTCQTESRSDTQHTWELDFLASRWFRRGWTLQELLAPQTVEFFSGECKLLGTKATLEQQINSATRIPIAALRNEPLDQFSVEERFMWVKDRETKKPEDRAYCLFGIFDVSLPVIYGEQEQKAFERLKSAIGVTFAEIDRAMQTSYEGGRLRVEGLSGQSLPLENCFINLVITHHTHGRVAGSTRGKLDDGSNTDTHAEQLSRFSLAGRLGVTTPLESCQVSLDTLFQRREREDGIISRPTRVIIWGRAGMGKTTLCKKIVHDVYYRDLWHDIYDRVVWLPLRRLKRTAARGIVELLQTEFLLVGSGERLTEALRRLFDDERTLFLLDGLDEVSFALDQDSPTGRLLRELTSRSHVIITSRPRRTNIFEQQPLDLEVETIGLYPQQNEEYMVRVAAKAKMTEETIDQIRAFIQSRPLVQSLAPIQLEAICHTWNMKGFVHHDTTMTTLYQMVTQNLWEDDIDRSDRRFHGSLLTKQKPISSSRYEHFIQEEKEFIQELGFRGLCEDVVEFDSEYLSSLETVLPIFANIPVCLSFLRRSVTIGEVVHPTLHFVHLTFQEFFAAQYFVRHWTSGTQVLLHREAVNDQTSDLSTRFISPEEFVKCNKYIDRYDVFWRFVVGLLHTEQNEQCLDRFIRTLDGEPRDLIGVAHQRLIIHCLRELSSPSDELRSQIRLLEDRYLQWISMQRGMKQKTAVSRFESSLMWESECSDYILESLLNGKETEAEALGMLSSRSSISSRILDMVFLKTHNGTRQNIQFAAIQVIGYHCGSDRKEKLFDEGWFRIMLKFATAWHDIAHLSEPSVDLLVQLLQNPDCSVRSRAAWALEGQARLSSEVVEILIELLHDPDSGVRSHAAKALVKGTTLHSDVVEILTRTLVQLLRDPDPGVRSRAAWALEGQARLSSEVVEILIELLHDPDSDVRFKVASMLMRESNLPSSAVNTLIQTLVQLLQDSDRRVRSKVSWALAEKSNLLSSEVLVQPLIWLLQDPDSEVLPHAASALVRQASLSNKIIETLIQQVQHLYSDVRSRVTMALGVAGFPISTVGAHIKTLIHLLQNPDHRVRSKASWALRGHVKLCDEDVKSLVQLVVQNRDSDARSQAAWALAGQVRLLDEAVEALVQLLQHLDESESGEWVSILTKRRDIQALLPTFKSPVLQQFIAAAMETGLPVYLYPEGYLSIGSPGQVQKIPMERHESLSFRLEWRKACEILGLADLISLLPVAATPSSTTRKRRLSHV